MELAQNELKAKNELPVWKYASRVTKDKDAEQFQYYKFNYESCQHEAKFCRDD